MAAKLIFIIGVYGAGKSYFVNEMFEKGIWKKEEFGIVSLDEILIKDAKKLGITHTEAYKLSLNNDNIPGQSNVDRCRSLMIDFFNENKSVVIDNANSTVDIRKCYMDIIPRHYSIEAIYIKVNDEEAYLERLEKRNNQEKYILPERAIVGLRNIEEPTFEEGFHDIKVISNI